jgi:hypothetical protein
MRLSDPNAPVDPNAPSDPAADQPDPAVDQMNADLWRLQQLRSTQHWQVADAYYQPISNVNKLAHIYDPKKAHDYYERHKHLKGRHHGSGQPPPSNRGPGQQNSARAKQKHELQAHITYLSKKLLELEKLIQIKEAALKRSKARRMPTRRPRATNRRPLLRKLKAKRDAKKYRQKHHQQLKNKAKQASAKSGGGSSKKAVAPRKKASSPSSRVWPPR